MLLLPCPPLLSQDFRPPTGELLQKIEGQWKSLDSFKTTFSATSAAVQGSGWGWLGYNKGTDRLEMVTMPNQDPLSMTVSGGGEEERADAETAGCRGGTRLDLIGKLATLCLFSHTFGR